MNERIVVYAGNRTVYPDMVTIVKSLLMHNKIDAVWLIIEDDVFPYKMPDCVKTINASNQEYFPPDGANMKTRYSYLVLMRAVLADLFPQYDKVLSLDIDTIVTGDISALWELPLEDYYFAAIEEPKCRKGQMYGRKDPRYYVGQDRYYNAGVMMYNLKKMREDGIWQKNVELLNTEEFYSVEQDTMNMICSPHILPLDAYYNSSPWTELRDDAAIVHFAGIKLEQWRKDLTARKYAEMPMESVIAANRKLSKKRKTPEERIVVYAGTRNLYGYMVTAVKSLLNCTRIDKVYLLIEDDEIPGIPEDVDCVEVLNVSDQPYFPKDSPNAKTILTYMVLMRAAYHRLFEKHKTVLSLDVDTICVRDISGIWDYDLTGYYIGAIVEPPCSGGGMYEKRPVYYNLGVALMNLEKLRDGMGDKIIEVINAGKTEAQEQTVFNDLCVGKILPLPNSFNGGNEWTGCSADPRIIHFAADRHWQQQPMIRAYRELRFADILEKQKKWRNT